MFRQCYSKQKRVCPGNSYDEGELIAVKSRLQWHRGRFLQFKPDIDFAHVSSASYFQIYINQSSSDILC